MSDKRTVTGAHLKGVEKRYQPSRCYMFVLQACWSDGSDVIIYRSYSDFFEFHSQLLDLFPIEGGTIDEKDRVIPFLPDTKLIYKVLPRQLLKSRKMFQRTEVLKVAQERQSELDTYCRELFVLPKKISQHSVVISFFEAKPEDINPPKTAGKKSLMVTKILSTFFKGYKKKEKEKSDDIGNISGPLQCEQYGAVADYKAQSKSTLSFKCGDVLDVIDKNANGWWFVQLDDKQGWAPASYLEPLDDSPEQDEAEPSLGESFITTKSYKGNFDDELSFEQGAILEVMNKALDGWWVANYNGVVGYVPSTYLKLYDNPFLEQPKSAGNASIPTGPYVGIDMEQRKPTPPRRRSIKNVQSRYNTKERDLTVYRRMTQKRKKNAKQKKPPAPDPAALDDLYDDLDDYLDPTNTDSLYEEIPYEDGLGRHYVNTHVTENAYINDRASHHHQHTHHYHTHNDDDSGSEYEDVGVYDDTSPHDSGNGIVRGDVARHSYGVDVEVDTTNVPVGLVKRLKNKINDKKELYRKVSSSSIGNSSPGCQRQTSSASTDSNISGKPTKPAHSPRNNNNGYQRQASEPVMSKQVTALRNNTPAKDQSQANQVVGGKYTGANTSPPKLPHVQSDSSLVKNSPFNINQTEVDDKPKPLNRPVNKLKADIVSCQVKNDAGVNKIELKKPAERKGSPKGMTRRDSDSIIKATLGHDPDVLTCLDQKIVSKFKEVEIPSNTSMAAGKRISPQGARGSPKPANAPRGKSKTSTLPTVLREKPAPSPRTQMKTATLASRIAQFEQT